ncbi:response regulator [Hahella sp. KA22]|uniref:hybrid sensor histidine kinase/response regulator n=1 Tax=Hahella sp. KA22 TaxID=1628392 RepID=UPI000FDE9F8E|nr:hybrid sensor histidine kinase/response regulator [Hahella sp. KA22]AZZ91060.1 response regulator [Hahella sp. KA22]QAY54430.1 response regulator [Hahella sp. KA22]
MDEKLIQQELQRGFKWLKFAPPVEEAYRAFHNQRVQARLPLVHATALAFIIIYSLLDYYLFPQQIASWTIPIRLFLVCPIIALALFAGMHSWPRRWFMPLYNGTYALGGLSVVAIIWIAHSQSVMVPYDGLFLVLIYGYFLMAIPFYVATTISTLIYGAYLLVELDVGMDGATLGFNAFFLFGANLIGAVGSYIQEHAQRTLFLNLQLVKIAQREAERANRSKTRFLAAASHDLRQPLNAMSMLAESLSAKMDRNSEEGIIVGKLRRSLSQLSDLFKSLLDMSQLSMGVVKPNPRHFYLHELVRRVAMEFDAIDIPSSRPERIETECDEELVAYSDPILLERMLRNLITNALQHADAKAIRVNCRRLNNVLEIHVVDDGVGIPSRDIKRIFKEFQQGGDEEGRPRTGIGLGLAIVRQLAGLLGGALSVKSSPGAGADFSFTIACGRAHLVAPQPEAYPETRTLGGMSVWLVEDDQPSREAMRQLLDAWGVQVAAFADARTAMGRLHDETPDMILSDYRLGGAISGLDVVLSLRRQSGRDIPAVIISADVEMLQVEAGRYPSIIFVAKPVTPARLYLILSRESARAVVENAAE